MLSIDFLAGFTIFLLALIVAAGMVPGMLAGLQSATIDYDGVAYRTSVILAEDPGWFEDESDILNSPGTAWESRRDDAVRRMGLAVSKETPNILSSAKIERFFDQKKYENDPAFYREKIFFSKIPYSFNIGLNVTGRDSPITLGDPLPEGDRGYIRRAVMVKEASSTRLNFSDSSVLTAYTDGSTAPDSTSTFSVRLMDFAELEKDAPAYSIDPFELEEEIKITLDNLNKTGNKTATCAYLLNVTLCRKGTTTVGNKTLPDGSILLVNGEKKTPPIDISNNVTFILGPGFFSNIPYNDALSVVFTFKNTQTQNTNITGTFDYVPTDRNVTVPDLKPGVLEVAVW